MRRLLPFGGSAFHEIGGWPTLSYQQRNEGGEWSTQSLIVPGAADKEKGGAGGPRLRHGNRATGYRRAIFARRP